MAAERPTQQLHMVFPESRLVEPPTVTVPAGYVLRTYRAGDDAAFIRLMNAAGFEAWNEETLKGALARALPEGIYFIEHQGMGDLVATAMATHRPSDLHPFGGELGWVATRPDHRGKGLGTAVCVAVIERYRLAGYRRVYLQTDDWRLPAIKVYLNLGFVPLLFAQDMEARWRVLCEKLNWPFTPDEYPTHTASAPAADLCPDSDTPERRLARHK